MSKTNRKAYAVGSDEYIADVMRNTFGNAFRTVDDLPFTERQQECVLEWWIRWALEQVEGSCSILVLTDHAIYAARDRLGRTPVTVGR